MIPNLDAKRSTQVGESDLAGIGGRNFNLRTRHFNVVDRRQDDAGAASSIESNGRRRLALPLTTDIQRPIKEGCQNTAMIAIEKHRKDRCRIGS